MWININVKEPNYYHSVSVKTEDGTECIASRATDGDNEHYIIWESNIVLQSKVTHWKENKYIKLLEKSLKHQKNKY